MFSTVEVASYQTTALKAPERIPINPVLENIGKCESNNNPKAKNPNSSASGRFQFIKSSWEYYGKQLWGDELKNKDVFEWDDNTELAEYVYSKNGTKDWESSKLCWSKITNGKVLLNTAD